MIDSDARSAALISATDCAISRADGFREGALWAAALARHIATEAERLASLHAFVNKLVEAQRLPHDHRFRQVLFAAQLLNDCHFARAQIERHGRLLAHLTSPLKQPSPRGRGLSWQIFLERQPVLQASFRPQEGS